MIRLFQDVVTNLSQKNVNCVDRDIRQGHENKILRPSGKSLINMALLKFKND